MPTSGPAHPLRPDGSQVDATFELNTVPVFELVYRHRARGRDDPRSVNVDYTEGLHLLLARLGSVGVSILGISVDSSVALELEPEDRELELPFPLRLDFATDVDSMRRDISRAQKPVARRSDAQAGGGNDQKTIRLTIACDDPTFDYDQLMRLLTCGTTVTTGSAASSAPHRDLQETPIRPRPKFPKVKDLIAAGLLPIGTILSANARGRIWQATLLGDGLALLHGESEPELFGKLTDRVAGHAESAMRLWSTERNGRLVRLETIRDQLAARPEWQR